MMRTVRLRNDPYHKQVRSVICTVSVRPYRRTRVVRQGLAVVARAARSAGVPNREPRVRGRPERPVRGGGSSCSTEVTFSRLGPGDPPARGGGPGPGGRGGGGPRP